MRTRGFVILLLLGLVAGLSAQAKPDFTGEWTLALDKSDFGALPAPTKQVRTIVHKDPVIKMTTAQTTSELGDTKSDTTFSTDGKPQQNTVGGNPMTTRGKWDGTSMVFNSTLEMQGSSVSIDDRYTLSDAGKTLTIVRTFTSPEGTATAKIVLVKK